MLFWIIDGLDRERWLWNNLQMNAFIVIICNWVVFNILVFIFLNHFLESFNNFLISLHELVLLLFWHNVFIIRFWVFVLVGILHSTNVKSSNYQRLVRFGLLTYLGNLLFSRVKISFRCWSLNCELQWLTVQPNIIDFFDLNNTVYVILVYYFATLPFDLLTFLFLQNSFFARFSDLNCCDSLPIAFFCEVHMH